MGYTNNWRRPPELPPGGFAAAIADFADIIPSLKVSLGGFNGSGDPVLNDNRIVFNGRSPLNCEPFEVARVEFDRRGLGSVMSFCKTQKLPYDLCVKVALIVLSHHLGKQFTVGSDGGDDDWAEACRLTQQHKGYGAEFHRTITD